MPRAADPASDEPVTRAVLLDARLRQAKDTGRVQVREIRILPGHQGGLHLHNGPVFGTVTQGSVTYQVDGQEAALLAPGDVFYEPEDTRIARFDAGQEGATVIAFFLLSLGQQPEIRFLDQPPVSDQGAPR